MSKNTNIQSVEPNIADLSVFCHLFQNRQIKHKDMEVISNEFWRCNSVGGSVGYDYYSEPYKLFDWR